MGTILCDVEQRLTTVRVTVECATDAELYVRGKLMAAVKLGRNDTWMFRLPAGVAPLWPWEEPNVKLTSRTHARATVVMQEGAPQRFFQVAV